MSEQTTLHRSFLRNFEKGGGPSVAHIAFLMVEGVSELLPSVFRRIAIDSKIALADHDCRAYALLSGATLKPTAP